MPSNDEVFYFVDQTGFYTMNLHYYIEVLDGKNGTSSYEGKSYVLDHTDSFKTNDYGWSTTKEDHYSIDGYTYTNNLKDGSSFEWEDDYSYGVSFYYTRNSYNLNFINNGVKEKSDFLSI